MTSIDHILIRAAGIAAFAVPLVIGILSASPEPYWLDSPEFIAAAQTLGIPHPPGHPLYVMLVKPFTLIPLGGIAFRVALASALFGAVASFLLHKIISRILEVAAPDLPVWIQSVIACSAALIASVAPGWWFQCVRAEVYSLQIMLVLAALYPLLLFCLRLNQSNTHLLYLAAFIAGLGMTNHHYIMIVALPAAIPPLMAQIRHLGGLGTVKLVGKLMAVAASGLLPYLFLPIRSASHALVSLGSVHSLKDFFWVVSAKVYQKSMIREHVPDLGDRSLDALFSMMKELGPVVIVASCAGIYLLLRRHSTRMVGLVLSLLVIVTVLLRSIMGFDPFNPDYYGYMLPVLAGFAAGFAVFAAIVLNVLRSTVRFGNLIALVLALALMIVPVVRAREARPQVDLSRFRATRLLLDFAFERTAPGTLVLSSDYMLFFVLWSANFIDGSRPDVTVVNPHLFGYPGYLNATLRYHPELRRLARSIIVYGKVKEAAVADLAWKGPLRMEPDLLLPDEVTRYILPDSPIYQTSPEPLSMADVAAASPDYLARWRGFYHVLGPMWKVHETWRMLSWCHFQDGLFLARRGDREGARQALKMATALGAKSPEIENLAKALDNDEKGPLDITPFIPQVSMP